MNGLLFPAIVAASLSSLQFAAAASYTITDHNGAVGYFFNRPSPDAIIVTMHGATGSAPAFVADPEGQIFARDMVNAGYEVLFLSSTWQLPAAQYSAWCDPSGYSGTTVTNCNTNSPAGNNQDVYNIQETLSSLATAGKLPSKLNVVLAGMSDGCFEAPNYANAWAAHQPSNVGSVKAIICQHELNQPAVTKAALPTVFVTSANDIVMPNTSSATAPCCYKFIAPTSIAAFMNYATNYHPGVAYEDPIQPISASDLTQRIVGMSTSVANAFIACLQSSHLGGTSPWITGNNWNTLPGGGPTSIFYDGAALYQGGWNAAAYPCDRYSSTLNFAVYDEGDAFDAGHEWVSFHDAEIVDFLQSHGL